jgi:hypothetical protein
MNLNDLIHNGDHCVRFFSVKHIVVQSKKFDPKKLEGSGNPAPSFETDLCSAIQKTM